MSAFMRRALPVLAAASTAYAASCSNSATTTIQNAGDASAIASCSTYSGSIAIATQVAGDISFNGLQKITGNLVANEGPNITSLGGDSLESVGDFELTDTTGLISINFPKLATVGSLKWISASVLSTVSAIITKADGIDIENTQLLDLTGFNLSSVGDMIIVNNPFITSLDMGLTNITGSLIVQGNNKGLTLTLPSLQGANNMTISSCSAVMVPELSSLGDSLVLRQNTFDNFTAPKLTKVGNSLVVNDNTKLTNLSFPSLTAINKALQIANNTLLEKIDGLPKLKTIGADLDIHGNFSAIDLPSLTDVSGTFNIQSTGDIQSTCDSKFKPMSVNGGTGRIRGKYTCEGTVSNPGGEGSTPSKTGSGAGKTGAANPLAVQHYGALSFAGVLGAFFL